MNGTGVLARWRSWAPQLQSLLRIVAAARRLPMKRGQLEMPESGQRLDILDRGDEQGVIARTVHREVDLEVSDGPFLAIRARPLLEILYLFPVHVPKEQLPVGPR